MIVPVEIVYDEPFFAVGDDLLKSPVIKRLSVIVRAQYQDYFYALFIPDNRRNYIHHLLIIRVKIVPRYAVKPVHFNLFHARRYRPSAQPLFLTSGQ